MNTHLLSSIKTNRFLIPTAIIIAGVLVVGTLIFNNYWAGGNLSAQGAAEKAMAFINQNIEAGVTASLVRVTDEDSVYKITLTIADTEYESYITKDGKLLFPSGINLEGSSAENTVPEETVVASDAFAQCLTEKGAKFYGAWWCSHCQNQKKLFGDALQYVSYVECEQNPGTSQGELTAACEAAGIESFPTWIFADGTKKTGELTLEQLSGFSGCPLQ